MCGSRQKLQQKALADLKPRSEKTSMKFGSFNLNGLDLETAWAVKELVSKHGFDVHKQKKYTKNAKFVARSPVLAAPPSSRLAEGGAEAAP